MGDAVESIYKLIVCEEHAHGLYHISSSKAYSELQIADEIEKDHGKELEKSDDRLEDQR